MPNTNRDTVQHLCQSIITRLENKRAIEFPAENRDSVRNEVLALVGGHILTEEDLRNQTLEKIGAAGSEVEASDITQSAQYRTAKSMVRKSFGDDELNGMYFQKTLKEIAGMIAKHFMQSGQIEEVYESDADLELMIVDIVKRFRPDQVH